MHAILTISRIGMGNDVEILPVLNAKALELRLAALKRSTNVKTITIFRPTTTINHTVVWEQQENQPCDQPKLSKP